MTEAPRIICVMIALLFMISAVPEALVVADVPTSNDDGLQGILDWVSKQPKTYTEDGDEVPMDGTPYFLENGFPLTTGSRASSRTLNACGSGYNQEGGGTYNYLLVWNGDANYPNASKRQEIKDEFDTVIWPNDTSVFGSISTSKIDICVKTMDGVGGLGGYFNGGDNIWIDAADINSWGYQIMAHEFQHMIHNQHDSNEELWLNEGNSDMAIIICYGGQASGILNHIMSFEGTPDNDLTVFNNAGYDYGSAATFVMYLWEHFGGNSTIRSLVANTQNGMNSVTNTLSSKGYSETGTEAFYRWTVANIMDDTSFDSGKWGYDDINVKVSSSSEGSFPASGSGTINNWAADYYTFTNPGVTQNLKIDLNAGSGSFRAYLALEGQGSNASKVVQMSLDGANDGSYTVNGFGSWGTYNKAHLIIATASSGGSYTWNADLIDLTPPITTLTVIPQVPDGSNGWYVSKPSIGMSVNEIGSSVNYHWDSEPDQLFTNQFDAPEGEHTLYYHSVDPSNNIELERSLPFKVDSVGPTTTMSVTPPSPDGNDPWYITTPEVSFNLDEPGETFYKFDEAANYTKVTGSIEMPDGIHKVHFYSVDLQGNVEKDNFKEFRVDTGMPSTTSTITPENATGENGWYIAPPTIELTSDDDATIKFWWDGDTESEYVGGIIAKEGVKLLHYYAFDEAGNKELEKTLEVKLDTVYPRSVITIDPFEPDGENDWYITTPLVALDLEIDLAASIYYTFDDEENFTLYDEELDIPEGMHILHWYAKDPAGNQESVHAEEIWVDTVTPKTTLKVTPDLATNVWYTEIPDIEFLSSENDTQILYHWDYDKPIRLSNALLIPEGRHVLYYHSIDDAGNEEKEMFREFRIDTQRPVSILNGPTLTNEDKAVTWDGTSSKDSNEVVSYFFNFGDGLDSGWISSSTTTHTYKKDGDYTVSLKVKDAAGLESDPQSQHIKVKKKKVATPNPWVPGDPVDPNAPDTPFYKKTVNLAGTGFPIWILLLLIIIIVSAIIAVGIASSRRRNRRLREERVNQMEDDIEGRWRPRREGDQAYDYGPNDEMDDGSEFRTRSYQSRDEDILAIQMTAPLEEADESPYFEDMTESVSEPTGPEPVAARSQVTPTVAAISKPPPTKGEATPVKAKATPAVAKARPVAQEEARRIPPASKAAVAPVSTPKKDIAHDRAKKPEAKSEKEEKSEDIDLDSEISDILGRLDL